MSPFVAEAEDQNCWSGAPPSGCTSQAVPTGVLEARLSNQQAFLYVVPF